MCPNFLIIKNKRGNTWHIQPVSTDVQSKIQQLADPYKDTYWSWLKDGSLGGAVATNSYTPDESDRYVLDRDRASWNSFSSPQGEIQAYLYLGDEHVYLCTNKGYGAFHAKEGTATYWKDGTCPMTNHFISTDF